MEKTFYHICATTEAQREIFATIRINASSNRAFNESITLSLEGNLKVDALKIAIESVVNRHAALKSVFSPDYLWMMTFEFLPIVLIEKQCIESEVAQFVEQEVDRTFDLQHGPLIRFVLLKVTTQKYKLIVTTHHSVCDGWSWAVLLDELGTYYSELTGGGLSFHPLPVQYWQYLKQLSERQHELVEHKQYWVDLFKDSIPLLDLPTDFERPAMRSFSSKRFDYQLDYNLVQQMRQTAAKLRVSFYSLLYSCYLISLYKITGQEDIVVGISAAAQSYMGLKNLIGHCVNLLPIRNRLHDQMTANELITQVAENLLDGFDHQLFTFGSLLKELPIDRDPSRIPLVNVIFNIDLQPEGQGLHFAGIESAFTTNPRTAENFEIFVNATVCGDRVVIETQYNTDLFSVDKVKNWTEGFVNICEQVVTNVDYQLISYHFSFDTEFKDQVKDITSVVNNDTLPLQDSPVFVDNLDLQEVLKIASDILQATNLKGEDNFFHHGGHSLLAAELMLKLNEQFSISIELYDIFSAQNFNELASKVAELKGEDQELVELTHHSLSQKRYPLSLQQFRAWYVQMIYPDSTLYNLPSLYGFDEGIDIEKVMDAVNFFRKKHLLLRAKLIVDKRTPYWQLEEYRPLKFKLNKQFKDYDELFAYLQKDAIQPFNLEQDDLFQVQFYQTADGKYYQYTKIHHLIWDGWSYDIFGDDLGLSYVGKNKEFATDAINYFDYITWQKEFHASSSAAKQLAYWKNILTGELPVLQLPLDYPRPTQLSYVGESIFIRWSEQELAPLEQLAQKADTTLFNVLLLGFYILLNKYAQQEDIIIGIPVQGREKPGLKEIVGFFASNIPIRVTATGNNTVVEILKQIKQHVAQGYSNAELGFDEVVKELKIERSASHTPVYQSFFMYQDSTNRQKAYELLPFSNIPVARGACHTDLDFWARRDPQGMVGGLDFMTELFKRESVERMGEELKFLLNKIAENADLELAHIDILPPEHRQELLTDLNQTQVVLPEGIFSVSQLIAEQCKLNSKKICAYDTSRELSYAELDQESNRLANYLREQGVVEGDLVGVALKRDVRLLIALQAIWKSGAGYVPLDPDFPDERLSYMVEHSQVKQVITNESLQQRSFLQGCNLLFIEQQQKWQSLSSKAPIIDLHKVETCYVIYTSGSTGKPKGVQLGHQSVINFLLSMSKIPGMKSDDCLCAITTLSFDISVLELFLPLVVGASVVIVGKDISLFGDKLITVLEKHQVNLMQATPASWRLLLHANWKPKRSFKILCGGEPFPKDLAHSLLELTSDVWNMYGPTETTVWSTCHKVQKDDPIIYIGRPIDNTDIYILNEDLEPVAYGVSGELYIGGKGLALSYLHNPKQTAEKFIPSPFKEGELIYNTGDLARYHHGGLLECLGRNDGQVKVRGYRIELGEIEAVIATIAEVSSQVVIVREDRPGDVRLVAYYLADQEIALGRFREVLAEKLPPYMIPAAFVHLDKFPMTLNHKIDRKKLPAPGGDEHSSSSQTSTGQTHLSEIEQLLLQKWQELLGQTNISVDDDFFELGGHSLLSVELFSFIEEQFGKSLPLSTLFEHGTIKKLAALLDDQVVATSTEIVNTAQKQENIVLTSIQPQNLVQLRSGAGRPVVFFHGVGGNVLNYRSFFGFIAKDRPIYGLQSSGVDGSSPLVESFSQMIIDYTQELLQFLPDGKFDLIGGSMGGLIALEVARRLQSYDVEIGKVVLFDTFGPNFDAAKFGRKEEGVVTRVKDSLRWRFDRYYYTGLYKILQLFGKPIPHSVRHHIVEQHNFNLLSNHNIAPYDGDVILIRGRMENKGRCADPKLGWEGIINGKLTVIFTDSDHDTIIESVEAGKKLKEIL